VVQRPRPVPDRVSAFYWDAAERHQLMVLRCEACRLLHHPPDVACPHCGATDLAAVAVSGRGTVFASTVARQAFDRAFLEAVPYVLALVELDEQPGVRILANVLDVADEPVAVGTPVEVTFAADDGWALPQFRVVTP
jgi:uncharacterized protein